MATLFDPSFSTSTRPPLSSADAPSMADSLPSIDFGFDDLRDRMAKFTAKFDNFIEQGRKRVLEERNQFRMNVAELKEDQRMKKKDIEILTLKTNTHQQTLIKEAAETNEMKVAIAALTAQRDAQLASRESIKEQIAETQKAIDAKLAAQRAHAQYLESQARFNGPELDFWLSSLRMRIDGLGTNDHLKITFTHVDEKDHEKEAYFELDVSSPEYDVRHIRPKLERERVDRMLEKTNETREVKHLFKGMRELFVEALKSG